MKHAGHQGPWLEANRASQPCPLQYLDHLRWHLGLMAHVHFLEEVEHSVNLTQLALQLRDR
jgi:hypothetical protein